ncbi:stage III sporulation protein AF [Domibacillus mangrovi]|uniref:Stage III sporulation protein AF n=1 Tax=Domibacillus mangrovi TaxID=1714354 RepID=A0A1Q5P7F9_9BACI|nr:stage III sporulation protein AF [Domibacillus mangrovi]OKL38081.1 stage III sporulation protein AF [Domibacillus mangrovi]
MQSIFDWLTGVLAVLLCAAIIDMIIPESSMQKYVRLVAGLVILTAIITPVFALLTGVDFSFSLENEQKTTVFQQKTDDHLKQMAEMESLTANPYMNQQLFADAELALQSYPSCDVRSVEADIEDNELKHALLTVKGTEESCPEEKIIDLLSQKWNIDAVRMNMVIQKGGSGGE